jgi:hypothetical protein
MRALFTFTLTACLGVALAATGPAVAQETGGGVIPPPAPSADTSEPAPAAPPAIVPAPRGTIVPGPRGRGPSSFRDRLLNKRLSRVASLKQAAAESNDPERMQQAEYLEGMILQMHEQGLISFGQKFLSAMQKPETPTADAPPAEIPEAELGEAAPFPGTELAPPELPPAAPPSTDGE